MTAVTNVAVAALVIVGAVALVNVKVCVAVPDVFVAVKSSTKLPPTPVGVPEMVAVPLALSTKLRPVGRAPTSVMAAAGYPVVVIVSLKTAPTIDVALLLLVNVGATFMSSTNVPAAATFVHVES